MQTQTDELRDFYTIREFAEKLRVHHNTIRRCIKTGRISAFRVGTGLRSAYRIPKSEISRIIAFDMNLMIEKMIDQKLRKE